MPIVEGDPLSSDVLEDRSVRVEHFESVDCALARLRSDVPPNPFAGTNYFPGTSYSDDDYEWATSGDGVQLVPSLSSPFWSPYLYRGQMDHHSPCLPSAFRGITPSRSPRDATPLERSTLLLRRVRLEEFITALADHPASAFAESIRLVTYPFAVAQHYGIATDRVDLTQDPEVAAFFATNGRAGDGSWQPIEDPRRFGVIYRLSVPRNALESRSPLFEWIGRQALPRPGEQRAWTVRLPFGCDFERLPVEVLMFRQQVACGRRLNEKFSGGGKLFPPDALATVAQSIASCKTVALRAVDRVLISYGCPKCQLQRTRAEVAEAFESQLGVAVLDREERMLSAVERETATKAVETLQGTFVGYARAVSSGGRAS
jgi:hypothetical protein